MRRRLLTLMAVALPALGAAQTPPATGDGATQMVRAAGMPLQDGALAPGSLTVRVVQGAFSGNLSGLDVELAVEGQAPKQARTGADGRAEFAHVPIGARVQASTTVGGERLASESFPMPADSGVRLLLVAGGEFVDTATAEGAQSLSPAPGAAPGTAPAPDAASPPPTSPPGTASLPGTTSTSVTAFRAFMVTATLLAFLLVGLQQWKKGRKR